MLFARPPSVNVVPELFPMTVVAPLLTLATSTYLRSLFVGFTQSKTTCLYPPVAVNVEKVGTDGAVVTAGTFDIVPVLYAVHVFPRLVTARTRTS